MKKTVAFLMCLSAAGLLAGCGAKTEATTAADTTGAASTETKAETKGDPVVINYYDWDIPDQKFIDDFNAANPDIQVVAHSIPANGERLTKLDILAMSGGDMDVMPISDGDQFTRFESGMLAPLDDFIAKDGVDMDKSFGKYAIWGQYDGKYYGIPFRATQSVVYYNKDMFEKAGITEVPTSLEGILAIGDDLKTKGGAGEPLALSIYGWYFEQWLCKQGLSYADNGNGRDAAAIAVEFDSNGGALNILNEWKALNDADVAPNVGRAGSDTATTDFTSGKAAITLGSTASLKQILQDINGSFEVGTAYFPTIKDGDEGGVSIGGASLWALNNNDDVKAAATWKFIKFLISPESQAYWNAETGYFPVTTAADEEQTFKDNVAQYPQFQTAIDQLHDSKPQYAGALLSVFPEARQIVETEIENMINGNETPEKAVESMASQINSSIEDYNLVNE